MNSMKDKLDSAFYELLNAGNKLHELSYKVEYAGNLIKLNNIKQHQVQLFYRRIHACQK